MKSIFNSSVVSVGLGGLLVLITTSGAQNKKILASKDAPTGAAVVATAESILEIKFPGEFDTISSQGVEYSKNIAHENLIPRGSAVLTGSGNLATQSPGITAIIHAASGHSFLNDASHIPTLEGVRLSVKNSLILARRFGHTRVAIPFIGGRIFYQRIGVSTGLLATAIIQSALENRQGCELHFVIYTQEETELFRQTLAQLRTQPQFQNVLEQEASVVMGDITHSRIHGASAIVNAANMEGIFGGGISGAISAKTGQSQIINLEVKTVLEKFNRRLLAE